MPTPWIGVDLDGTLATYEDGQKEIGFPIIPMMTLVKEWVQDGKEVRIFTARAGDSAQIPKIQKWLDENGLGGLKITNVKDLAMVAHYDDKAVRVQRNTGNLCFGCSHVQWEMNSRGVGGNLITDC
jgi:fructoselysine-6-P-deglycase FrlB-like protein